MSFCRFSSDDFRCDFYAYESEYGYELYVAASRITWDPPPNPLRHLELDPEEWQEMYRAYHEALQAAPRSRVLHAAAGGHSVLPSLTALRDRIAELASQGLHAPPWLIPDLDALIAEEEGKRHQPEGNQPDGSTDQ